MENMIEGEQKTVIFPEQWGLSEDLPVRHQIVEVKDPQGRPVKLTAFSVKQEVPGIPPDKDPLPRLKGRHFVIVGGLGASATLPHLMVSYRRFGDVTAFSTPEGLGSVLPKPEEPFNIENFYPTGYVLLEALKALGLENVDLIGISAGAAYVIEAAALDAQEVVRGEHEPKIDTLVIVDAGGMVDQDLAEFKRSIWGMLVRVPLEEIKAVLRSGGGLNMAMIEAKRAVRRGIQPGLPEYSFLDSMRVMMTETWRRNFELVAQNVTKEACQKVKAHVILLWGEEDRLIALEKLLPSYKAEIKITDPELDPQIEEAQKAMQQKREDIIRKWGALRPGTKKEMEKKDLEDFWKLWGDWVKRLREKYEKHRPVYDKFYEEYKERLMEQLKARFPKAKSLSLLAAESKGHEVSLVDADLTSIVVARRIKRIHEQGEMAGGEKESNI